MDLADALVAAQTGDEEAFALVYRAVQPGLLRYLTVLIGQDAADVAAETWVDVVRGLARFTGGIDGFRAWVYTIARRRSVDAYRHRARRPEELAGDEAFGPDVDRSGPDTGERWERPGRAHLRDPALLVEQESDTASAVALIGRLPTEQAEIVMLRVVVGLSPTEVASLTGRSTGAVRVACHRGLRRLAQMLDPDPQAAPPGGTGIGERDPAAPSDLAVTGTTLRAIRNHEQ